MELNAAELWRMVRFLIVGGVNTLFGVGVYCLLIYLGLGRTSALTLGTILGVLFNFKTSGTFVFRNTDNRLLFKFVACYVVVYVANLALLWALHLFTPINDYYAGMMAIPLTAIISYFIQRNYVYKKD
jgi:putative flippase GtrA